MVWGGIPTRKTVVKLRRDPDFYIEVLGVAHKHQRRECPRIPTNTPRIPTTNDREYPANTHACRSFIFPAADNCWCHWMSGLSSACHASSWRRCGRACARCDANGEGSLSCTLVVLLWLSRAVGGYKVDACGVFVFVLGCPWSLMGEWSPSNLYVYLSLVSASTSRGPSIFII